MSEGPEAKVVTDVLNVWIVGWILTSIDRISDSPLIIDDYDQLICRFPLRIVKVYSVGKRVIIQLEEQVRIVVSLRMTGAFVLPITHGKHDPIKSKPIKSSRALFNFVRHSESTDSKPLTNSNPTPSTVDESKSVCNPSDQSFDTPGLTKRRKIESITPDNSTESSEMSISTIEAIDSMIAMTVAYNDTRPLSEVSVFTSEKEFTHWRNTKLGWDPLNEPEKMDAGRFFTLMQSRSSIVTRISDQEIICGLGNYARSEACHRAGLDPFRKANSLDRKESDRLFEAIKSLMLEAYQKGGHTLESFKDPLGRVGTFVPMVYGRKGKLSVDTAQPVSTKVCNGQTVFWCPDRVKV